MNKNKSNKNPKSKNSKSVGIFFYTIIIFIIAFLAGNFFNHTIYPRFLTPSWEEISVPKTVDKNLPFNLIWEVWETAQEDYVEQPVSDKDLFYGSLGGIIKSLDDPYSTFFNPEDADFFLDTMSGDFEGVGIEITIKDNYLTVISPLPETPAKRAGIEAGDKIYSIDGKDTLDMSLDEAARLIRGPKGEPVTLTVLHKGASSTEEIEIVRDTIELETVSWEIKDENIGYINISHFSGDTWKDFKNIARVVKNANPKGIILDLRNNPGGYLGTSVDIAGFWLGQEIVTVSKDGNDNEEEYKCYGNGQFKEIPTIVLVNEGSASASEIISGAMQDYEQGLILGEKTFGKGSVQELKEFSDGSAVKITVAHWYTPKGRSIEENGIMPDVEVKLQKADFIDNKDEDKDEDDDQKDPQINRAIEILQNKDKYKELIKKETKKAENKEEVDNNKDSDEK
ncbi:MAG TPA: S41 family peptidase [Patescibacteria group bacterium]|nr:S41 family peptidase [Patescibacteria group bacterium]